jgi:glycosyltransferase involved in cell wall biosynthesis
MIVAAIPVKNSLKWTAPLVDQLILGDEVDEIWIYDNGSTDLTKYWVQNIQKFSAKVKYKDASRMEFYEMWNHMVKTATDIGNVKLAILNNDIRLPHMALRYMAENMDGYQLAQVDGRKGSFDQIIDPHPVEIHWTERIGYAFMMDADFWTDQEYAVHPDFIIWFGDDDLFKRCAVRGGRICEMKNLGCDHGWHQSYQYYSSVSGSMNSDVHRDRETFLKIWGSR